MGFFSVLALILITLKLTKLINISWLTICLIPVSWLLLVMLVGGVLYVIQNR